MKDKIKFLPLLLLYVLIVLITATSHFRGDEGRYVQFSNNLSQGYYSPPGGINLWNGPGYPIVLLPFVLLKLPWLTAKLMNSLLLFAAILLFYKTLCLYMHKRHALSFSYLLGIYPPILRYLGYLLTEVLAIFLICGFLFHFCKLYQSRTHSWKQLFFSSFYLGYLALTKIIFGYILLGGLLFFLALWLWQRKDAPKKTVFIYLLALLFCLPYLSYTYSLTGKIFYWGNSGGQSLYWMSTPYKNELGDWYSAKSVSEVPELRENHQKVFSELVKLPGIKRDDEFRRLAIHNIIHNPAKYLKNWLANIGRLLFSYPYSYTPQKLSTYFFIIPNMFLVVLSVLCICPSFWGRKFVPYEIYALLLFGVILFISNSLVSAYNRQFLPLVPLLILWISHTLTRIVKLEMRQ